MPFLFPGLLALGAIAAVPVIIHLLNRQRYKKIRWAAMKFLMEALREETKRIQYKDWLLMALRALACLLLVLAIARPVTRLWSGGSAETRRAAILVLDNSASMSRSTGAETLFEASKRQALSILRELPAGVEIGLIETARPSAVLLARSTDPLEVQAFIEGLEVKHAPGDLSGAMRHARKVAEGFKLSAGHDLYFLTDLQERPWRREAETLRRAIQDMGESSRAYLVRMDSSVRDNLAATALEVDFPRVTVKELFSVQVEIRNGGEEASTQIPVDLYVDGAPVASKTVPTLDPGASQKLSFLAQVHEPGDHLLEAVVDKDRGRLAVDDRRRLVVEAVEGIRVTLVDGEPGKKFGESETDFLKAVLQPLGDEAELDENAERPAQAFQVQVVPAGEFAPDAVHRSDLLMLANVPRLDDATAQALRERVAEGMGLLVFLGPNVDVDWYNRELATEKPRPKPKQKPDAQARSEAGEPEPLGPLLPARIGEIIPDAEEDAAAAGKTDRRLVLSPEYLEHPWMRFFRPTDRRVYLDVAVKKAFRLELPEHGGGQVVARYINEVPAVVERRFGEGQVGLIGTTADLAWNELFREPLGPILVKRMTQALLTRAHVVTTADAGETIYLPLRPEERRVDVTLQRPDDKLQTVAPDWVRDRPVLIFEDLVQAGTYRVKLESAPPREALFALNVASEESDLRALNEEEWSELFPGAAFRLFTGSAASSVGAEIRRSQIGTELWWPVLLLAFLVFLTEIVLARLFTKDAPSLMDVPELARRRQHRGPAGAAVARGSAREAASEHGPPGPQPVGSGPEVRAPKQELA